MQSIRIVEMPDCKMVSSGVGMFGDESFDLFDKWMSAQPPSLYAKDFLAGRPDGFEWFYLYKDGMNVPEEFKIVDFKGGLYAVATDIDGQTDIDAMNTAKDEFLQEHGLVRDGSRLECGNVIGTPKTKEVLGFEQMDYYTPVKSRKDTNI